MYYRATGICCLANITQELTNKFQDRRDFHHFGDVLSLCSQLTVCTMYNFLANILQSGREEGWLLQGALGDLSFGSGGNALEGGR